MPLNRAEALEIVCRDARADIEALKTQADRADALADRLLASCQDTRPRGVSIALGWIGLVLVPLTLVTYACGIDWRPDGTPRWALAATLVALLTSLGLFLAGTTRLGSDIRHGMLAGAVIVTVVAISDPTSAHGATDLVVLGLIHAALALSLLVLPPFAIDELMRCRAHRARVEARRARANVTALQSLHDNAADVVPDTGEVSLPEAGTVPSPTDQHEN